LLTADSFSEGEPMSDYYSFLEGFAWGAATASYQVEGAVDEDGRGRSIWDTFAHTAGRTYNDENADVAVDHYHRYQEDVDLMAWMGLKAYRFSIAWPRIMPTGRGAINEKGLAYYDRLVDALLEKGIQPWPTLFHWDLPQALEDEFGGWESREMVSYFGDYAALVADRLSDRVGQFFTMNEFKCFVDEGYYVGVHAPGRRESKKVRNQMRHHALLAHGTAVEAIRANAHKPVRVGIADNPHIPVPVIETDEHIDACRKAMRRLNAPYMTAVMEGVYMAEYLEEQGADAPEFTDADMALISQPLDVIGFNTYTPDYVRADDGAEGFAVVPMPASYPKYNIVWLSIGPQIAYWGPRLMQEVWDAKEIYISENGACCADKLTEEGRVDDTDRLMYLRNHFINAHRAVSEGIPLKGYFIWTLLDNFEWSYGYSKRFGLIYTNFSTLERIPKLSAHYYKEVCERNAVV
jgi:beta-glucosidase